MKIRRILVGTGNQGKLREILTVLEGLDVELSSLADHPGCQVPPEDGETYRENARIKAEGLARETGLPVMAEDSGLEVDALDGRPGIRSARFAGEAATDRDRTDAVLREMAERGVERSPARYRCAIVLATPEGILVDVEADCEGEVAPPPRGENGFGYDPVFTPRGYERTFGELPGEVKNQISHRARALALFRERLQEILG